MNLTVSFEDLYAEVRRMGANSVEPELVVQREMIQFDPIDVQLEEGIEVELSEVEVTAQGLFSYKGRQILLYIQDHRVRVQETLDNGGVGNKFHVAHCRTLEDMDSKRRYERYVATNELGGYFYITGYDFDTKEKREGKARLNVCKNCLRKLNYQNYRRVSHHDRNQMVAEFDLKAFFAKYESSFRYMPRRRAGAFDGNYTDDWQRVARRYKQTKNFTCESCQLDLSDSPDLLHVHHVDGVKTNNSPGNLKALCSQCHRSQIDHDHLIIKDEDAQRIYKLRREQRRPIRERASVV